VKRVYIQGNGKHSKSVIVSSGAHSIVFSPYLPSIVGDGATVDFINTASEDSAKIASQLITVLAELVVGRDVVYVYLGGRDGWPAMAYGLLKDKNIAQYYYRQLKGNRFGIVRKTSLEKLLGPKVQDDNEPPAA